MIIINEYELKYIEILYAKYGGYQVLHYISRRIITEGSSRLFDHNRGYLISEGFTCVLQSLGTVSFFLYIHHSIYKRTKFYNLNILNLPRYVRQRHSLADGATVNGVNRFWSLVGSDRSSNFWITQRTVFLMMKSVGIGTWRLCRLLITNPSSNYDNFTVWREKKDLKLIRFS